MNTRKFYFLLVQPFFLLDLLKLLYNERIGLKAIHLDFLFIPSPVLWTHVGLTRISPDICNAKHFPFSMANEVRKHDTYCNSSQFPSPIYSSSSFLCLKNHKNEQNMKAPVTPVIISTHLNASGSSNNGISMFMPNTPATTPNMATTNIAVVSSSSNWISWFRTLSWRTHNRNSQSVFQNPDMLFDFSSIFNN